MCRSVSSRSGLPSKRDESECLEEPHTAGARCDVRKENVGCVALSDARSSSESGASLSCRAFKKTNAPYESRGVGYVMERAT